MSQPKTMRELASQDKKGKKLHLIMKVAVNVLYVIPTVMLFFYASGMWVPKSDSLDNILTSGAIFAGIFGLLAINFVIIHLEDQ